VVNHLPILLATRNRLLSLEVVTTGSTALGSTATAYTRATGSFITDGFMVGMEVKPAGFASNNPGVVSSVSDLVLGITGGRPVEAAGGGRSLTVGIPDAQSWENIKFTPTDGRWFIEEDYLPGATRQKTLGTLGELDIEPAYVLRLYGIAGKGAEAIYKVASAVLRLFKPNATYPTSDGHIVRVGSDPAPYQGQLSAEGSSHAMVTITIPLWVRTQND
jgi:hypothetical protein